MLPAWVDNQLEAQNLDVRKLEESNGLWRLRVGAYRVVFQILGRDVIVQRIFRRREADDYDGVKAIPLVPFTQWFANACRGCRGATARSADQASHPACCAP